MTSRSEGSGKTGQQTRQKVIDAAIHCIAKLGFHKATSNRIALEAGVSWGVIQYHFGDKEGILSAVLDHIFPVYTERFSEVSSFAGSTLYLRLSELISAIWKELNTDNYRASVEILQNVQRDPDSRIDGQKYLDQWSSDISQAWDRLFADVAYNPARSQQAKRILFASLRGFAESRALLQNAAEPVEEFRQLANMLCFSLSSAPPPVQENT